MKSIRPEGGGAARYGKGAVLSTIHEGSLMMHQEGGGAPAGVEHMW